MNVKAYKVEAYRVFRLSGYFPKFYFDFQHLKICTIHGVRLYFKNLFLRRNFISVTKSYIYVPSGSEAKQSYISMDGKTWADIASKQYTYKYPEKAGLNSKLSNLAYLTLGNLCIKAFAEEPKPETETNRFDINKDGAADSADYLLIHSYFLGLEMPKEYLSESLFDLNGDGIVNISDIIAMKAELL